MFPCKLFPQQHQQQQSFPVNCFFNNINHNISGQTVIGGLRSLVVGRPPVFPEVDPAHGLQPQRGHLQSQLGRGPHGHRASSRPHPRNSESNQTLKWRFCNKKMHTQRESVMVQLK